MFHDMRSPYERARDDKRCPTCGHRPADAVDELARRETGGAGFRVKSCPQCGGSGWAPAGHPASPCQPCNGRGSVAVVTARNRP